MCNASYPDIITTVIVTLNTPHNYDHVRFFILRVPTPDHGNTRTGDVINMLGTDRNLYADRHIFPLIRKVHLSPTRKVHV